MLQKQFDNFAERDDENKTHGLVSRNNILPTAHDSNSLIFDNSPTRDIYPTSHYPPVVYVRLSISPFRRIPKNRIMQHHVGSSPAAITSWTLVGCYFYNPNTVGTTRGKRSATGRYEKIMSN
jgi:hypothetical protein